MHEQQRILEVLFRQHYSGMIHLAKVLLGNEEEAEDVVQDIFLRVANSDITPKSEGYLLTAVRNACLNRIYGAQNETIIFVEGAERLGTLYLQGVREIEG